MLRTFGNRFCDRAKNFGLPESRGVLARTALGAATGRAATHPTISRPAVARRTATRRAAAAPSSRKILPRTTFTTGSDKQSAPAHGKVQGPGCVWPVCRKASGKERTSR